MIVRYIGAVAAGMIAIMQPVKAAAAQPMTLKPISPWSIEQSDDTCRLARTFGTAEDPYLLRMRADAPGYKFDITLAGAEISAFQNATERSITYGSGAALPFTPMVRGALKTYGPAIVFFNEMTEKRRAYTDETEQPFPNPPLEAGVDRIGVAASNKRLVLETGPIGAAMDAMRKCMDDVVRGWGLDPAVQSTLSRPVTPLNRAEVNALVAANDPPAAVRALGGIARVHIRLMVDAMGKPVDCTTWPTDQVPDFKVDACEIMLEKARYAPALDANGVAVPSYFVTSLVFRVF
jgi:hypothetical protein